MSATQAAPGPHAEAAPERCPRLDRAAIEAVLASGRRLLVQGGMGIHASDGLAGKVASHRGARLAGVGTVSAGVTSEEHLRREIRRLHDRTPQKTDDPQNQTDCFHHLVIKTRFEWGGDGDQNPLSMGRSIGDSAFVCQD